VGCVTIPPLRDRRAKGWRERKRRVAALGLTRLVTQSGGPRGANLEIGVPGGRYTDVEGSVMRVAC